MRAILVAIVSALLLTPAASGQPGRQRLEVQIVDGREAVAREVLVKLNRALNRSELARLGAETDGAELETLGSGRLLRLRSRSLNPARLTAVLRSHPEIAYVEPNFIIRLSTEPNDPSFPQLWGLRNLGQAVNDGLPGVAGADIHASEAWDHSTGSTENVVAVVDTGIDYTHPDLAANMWSAPADFTVNIGGVAISCPAGSHGFNAILMTCDPMDDHNHGTHVAGTIGASGDNGVGVVGINWSTRLMGLKFIDAGGSGTVADAVKALQFAIEVKQAFGAEAGANIRVLSNSWGGSGFSQALLDGINAVNEQDMLFVAAAGNDSSNNDALPTYPASYDAPNVIGVAATTNTEELAWFSNYGVSSVDLGAPGFDILSTTIGNTYAFASGTSMAAPHVSGAAALVLSRCPLSAAELKETLLGSVQAVSSLSAVTATGGRLDVNSALHACLEPPATPGGLVAAAGDARVTLTWPSALGATGYNVKRSETAGGPYSTVASAVKGGRFVDTTVTNDTTYYYVVSATNSLGESGDSNEASATPKSPSDLIISFLSVPLNVGAGTTVPVSVTTRNQGPGFTTPSTTRLYLSEDSELDSSDLPFAPPHLAPALGPGVSSAAILSIPMPAELPIGLHFLIAKADTEDVVVESSDANNTQVRFFYAGPDLIVSSLTGPAAAAAGAAISVTETVKNQGGGSSAGSVTRFYLSANASIDASDTLLDSARAVPALGPDATSSGPTTLTIPPATAPGFYYIVAKADADDAVVETEDSNNSSPRFIQIGADLLVSALNAPATATAGSSIVATDTTVNQAQGSASPTVTRFYLSTNTVLDQNDVLLAGARALPALGGGVSSSGSTTLVIPSSTPAGVYYLFAKADADNAVIETQETNNDTLRSIQIGTDVVVTALTVPAKAGAGSSIVVSETTANQGTGIAPPSVTRFYLSANALLDAGDTLLGAGRDVPQLSAAAASSGSTALLIPASVAPNFYYVIAKADADNVVVETQEGNNTLARMIQIGPDLVVTSFFGPSAAAAGSSLTLSDTTWNQGGGASAVGATAFYFSTNSTLDAADTRLHQRTVALLQANGTSSGSTSVTLPGGLAPGLYYLIASADADNTTAETVEFNNVLTQPMRIGPDLSITASAPFIAAAGSVLSVTNTVSNVGGDAAASSTVKFYLSLNTSLDASDTLLPANRVVPALAPSGSSSGTTAVTIPAGTPPGYYVVLVCADGDNVVTEAQETNNLAPRVVQVTAP